ncbi:hypothetical protein [uncultured Sphaerochaeta sp.]|uniref:hypothetical protein n=1 Tax=uncultured Sphaerochaeta sp. TaxID=886478 RepID=UPI002A0A66D0|nr:hypothetical protein [uncultured Sphaerochaeta sp.]
MNERIFQKIKIKGYLAIGFSLAGFLFVFVVHRFFPSLHRGPGASRLSSIIGLMGTTLFCVAIPILLRTGFFQKSTKTKGLDSKKFIHMELACIISVCIGELFMLVSYYIPIYTYHLYLTVLVGIYGIYSIFPSKESYKKELSSFGVHDDKD